MIIKIIKILLFLLYLIIFIILNFLWYYFFGYFEICREIFANITIYILNLISKLLLANKIILVDNNKLNTNKINIINSNHTYQFDLFVLYYIFSINKIKGKQYSSISTNNNIGIIDKSILNIIEASFVNNSLIQNNLKNSIQKWKKRKYNSYIINFFEGITKCDSNNINTNYKYLLEPKCITLIELQKNGIQYINDINIVYTCNNKIINCKNIDIYYKILFDDVKIYVTVNNYKIPKHTLEEWIKKLYNLKDKQIEKVIKKYNII